MERNNRNLHRAGSSRRNDLSGSRDNTRNRNIQLEHPSEIRNATFLDEVVLSAIIRSGMMESIRPVNSAQFRSPVSQASPYLEHSDSFGSHVDALGGWMPRNINLANLSAQHQNVSKKPKEIKPEPFVDDDQPPKKNNRFLLPKLFEEEEHKYPSKKIIEKKKAWVSKVIDAEIERHLEKLTVQPIDFGKILNETELSSTSKKKISPTTKRKKSIVTSNNNEIFYKKGREKGNEKAGEKVSTSDGGSIVTKPKSSEDSSSKASRKARIQELTVHIPNPGLKSETISEKTELTFSTQLGTLNDNNASDKTNTITKSKSSKKKVTKSKTAAEHTPDAKQINNTEAATFEVAQVVEAGSSKQKSNKNEQ